MYRFTADRNPDHDRSGNFDGARPSDFMANVALGSGMSPQEQDNIAHELTRSNDYGFLESAVIRGAGIWFVGGINCLSHPELIEVKAPLDEWTATFWEVTHVDMHHTRKVPSAKVMAYTYLTPSWVILWEIEHGRGTPARLILPGVVLTVVALWMLVRDTQV